MAGGSTVAGNLLQWTSEYITAEGTLEYGEIERDIFLRTCFGGHSANLSRFPSQSNMQGNSGRV